MEGRYIMLMHILIFIVYFSLGWGFSSIITHIIDTQKEIEHIDELVEKLREQREKDKAA